MEEGTQKKGSATYVVIAVVLVLLVAGYFVSKAVFTGPKIDTEGLVGNIDDYESTAITTTQSWPSYISPNELPEYKDGQVGSSSTAGIMPYVIGVVNTSEKAVSAYVDELKSLGYESDEAMSQALGVHETEGGKIWNLGKHSGGILYSVSLTFAQTDASGKGQLNINFIKQEVGN